MKMLHVSIAVWVSLIMMGASSCNGVTVQDWISKVDPLRVKATQAMSGIPYQLDQHQAFKEYFYEIEQMALKLTQEEDYIATFNDAIAKVDLNDACARVFLERQNWQFIMNNCSKNGLFICSEEVRFYPELVAAVRKKLIPEHQKRFDSTPSCQRAI